MKSKKGFKTGNRYAKYAYLFLSPLIIVYCIFHLFPLIYTIMIGFSDMHGFNNTLSFAGFDCYKYFFTQTRFYQALFNTIVMWVYSFILQFSFALIFAYIFTSRRIKIRGKGIYKALYYLPKIITTASVAVLFNMLWSAPSGTLYMIFAKIGIFKNVAPLEDANLAQIIYSTVSFWQWFGSIMILICSGMLTVPPDLYEAAEIDGAGKVRTFFSITIPQIRPVIVYVVITSLIGGLQSFELSYLFNPFPSATGYVPGGPATQAGFATETLAVYIYTLAFGPGNFYNYASALSVILLLISCALSFVTYRFMNEKEEQR